MLYTTLGQEILLDEEDEVWAKGYSWYLIDGYPRTWYKGERKFLHTIVAESMEIIGEVDHKDRNRRNSKKDNIRAATRSQNMANRGIRPDNTSGYIGVHFVPSLYKWQARLQFEKVRKNLGYYWCPREAAIVRDEFAIKCFGDRVELNFLENREIYLEQLEEEKKKYEEDMKRLREIYENHRRGLND